MKQIGKITDIRLLNKYSHEGYSVEVKINGTNETVKTTVTEYEGEHLYKGDEVVVETEIKISKFEG